MRRAITFCIAALAWIAASPARAGEACPFQATSSAEKLCATWRQIWPKVEHTTAAQGDAAVCGYMDRLATLYRLTPDGMIPSQNLQHMAVRLAALQALEAPQAAAKVRDLGIQHTCKRAQIYVDIVQGKTSVMAGMMALSNLGQGVGREFNAEVERVRKQSGCASR